MTPPSAAAVTAAVFARFSNRPDPAAAGHRDPKGSAPSMFRFSVHAPLSIDDAALAAAHLLGPDAVAVRGEVRRVSGGLACRRAGSGATALAVPVEIKGLGRLMLQTCLLPPREEPYDLAIELARFQVKSFLARSEDWQMFEGRRLTETERAVDARRGWEQARVRFTEALVGAGGPGAAVLAVSALGQAIQANERLAAANAELMLRHRFAVRPASRSTLGVRIWPERDGEGLRSLVSEHFDVVFLPIRWRDIEVEEDRYVWGPLDRWMEWAASTGKPVVAGPLADFSAAAVPEWMYVWQHDFDETLKALYGFMEQVLARYAGRVAMWNLASGINVNDNFTFTSAQMVSIVRNARLLVKQYRPKARAMVEIRQPFGEHTARNRDSVSPLPFVTHLRQEGVQLDAVGVQLLLGDGPGGSHARDLLQVSALLDHLHHLDSPLLVSAIGVPSGEAATPSTQGWWHEHWSPSVQERWTSRLFTIALGKPQIETIVWTDLYDHPGAELPRGGLLDEAGRPKPALTRLLGMRRRLRRPLGTDGTEVSDGDAARVP